MTDIDTILKRTRQLTVAWIFVCTSLFGIIYVVVRDNQRLHDELAKPPRLTMQQKHEVIKDYLADGETRFALRQQIGCTDKE